MYFELRECLGSLPSFGGGLLFLVGGVGLALKDKGVHRMDFFDPDGLFEIASWVQPAVEKVPHHMIRSLNLDRFFY